MSSMNVDPSIIHYGQWGLFIFAYVFGIWCLGYFVVMTSEKFSDVSNFFGGIFYRSRTAAETRIKLELDHLEALKKLELEKLQALQEMELERERLSYESVNQELRKAVQS